MQISLQQKIDGKWKPVPVLPEGDKRYEQIKALAGTESLLEIVTNFDKKEIKEYYCGTKVLFEKMCNAHRGKELHIITEGELPVLLSEQSGNIIIAIRAFYTEKAVELAFPPKRGWDHLKPEA